MGLKERVGVADKNIEEKLNEASREIVIEEYRPIIDSLKKFAVEYMNQQDIKSIAIGVDMSLKRDGSFYDNLYLISNESSQLSLEELPSKYLYADNAKKGLTKYHGGMRAFVDDFRKSIQESVRNLLELETESCIT